MATQEETKQAVEDGLERIGREYKITFTEFATENYSQGGHRAGMWTYNFIQQRVYLEYWFSSFSSRKEEVTITFAADDDLEKLEKDLRDCLQKVREFVKRKKGMF